MPFTLSHPAIVVPIKRRFPQLFDLTGIVIGSLSPDFEYFVRLKPIRSISHDLIGIPLLCLPSGLIAWLVFDRVMKRPLVELTPRWAQLRLRSLAAPIPIETTRAWIRVIVSLCLGALSHIVWDGFTHENGWFVDRIPILNRSIGSGPKVYKVLQHLSTFVGFGFLAFWSGKWLQRQIPATNEQPSEFSRTSRTIIITLLVVSACGLRAFIGQAQAPDIVDQGLYGLIVRTVIATISSGVIGFFLFSLVFQARDFRVSGVDNG